MMSETPYTSEAVVNQYISDVLEGRIPACKWVKLACERHVRDLEEGEARGIYFEPEAGQLVIDFFELLKHSKGEWAGQTLSLEPWQLFFLWVLFGWQREDGTRRFRTSYLEIARKNGKSTIAAGIGLFLMVADGEPGAEIYSVATHRDQAKITHSEATRMVKASQALRRKLTVFVDNIHIRDTASKFQPLGRDSDSMDGLNIHGVIIDELHAHKTREVVDKMETAMGARRNPLQFEITTAGYDRRSICFEHNEYTQKVLEGVVEDDAWFGIIFTIDADDNWEDEKNWIKANPNLGISKKWDHMRDMAAKAKEMPSALNAFLRLELDVWTQAVTKWVPRNHWDACGKAVDSEGLRGRRCMGGLDLSSTTDVSAFVMVFPPEVEEDDYQVLCRFFIPEEAMHIRSRRDRVPYEAWVRQGYMNSTVGNVVDYAFILAQIEEDAQLYDLNMIAFDRWGATKIVQDIDEMGLTCVDFGQGYASMNAPMKEMERLIRGHSLAHGNQPVLGWMADNLVVRIDPAGNIKPDKERSLERIDGMVALVMALDLALRKGEGKSVYESRGLREV
ncbi:MAG: terminase large subunit [Anaerolineaceae bacterium]|nr:terminase large subunit [Anaerolineaceae bacterium]